MSGSREFYREGEDGKKEDAFLHDEILDNPEAERSTRMRIRDRALAQGMSQEDVDKYLPLD